MNRRVVCARGGLPVDVLTVIEEPEPAAPERVRTALESWPTSWSTRYGPARSAPSSSAPGSRRYLYGSPQGASGMHGLEQWVIDNVGPR
jgi:hypothetical protein